MKDAIQELLDYKHKITKEQTANLTHSDLKKLVNVLKSGKEHSNLKKIIIILAVAAPNLVRDQLKEMMQDEKRPEYLRILCAICLNNIYDDNIEDFYLKRLTQEKLSNDLKLKLVKGLGKFGSKKSLVRLTALQKEFPMHGITNLSKLLILSRNQLTSQVMIDYEPVSLQPVGRREKLKWATRPVEDLKKFTLYGMDASEETIQYRCGKSEYIILKKEKLSKANKKKYQLASVISAKSKYSNTYYTKLLLFLAPINGKERDILGFRTDGLLAYAGRLDEVGNFLVSSIKKFGSDQVSIAGKLVNERLIIEEFYSSNRLTAKKRPTKVKL